MKSNKLTRMYWVYKMSIFGGIWQPAKRKVQTPLCTISFRKSKPLEVAESFADSIFQYLKVSIEVNSQKVKEALDQLPEGEKDPLLDLLPELTKCISTKTDLSKTALGNIIKEGTVIPGVQFVEKKNLQIK